MPNKFPVVGHKQGHAKVEQLEPYEGADKYKRSAQCIQPLKIGQQKEIGAE